MGEGKGVEKLIGAVRELDDKDSLLLLVGDDASVLPPHEDVRLKVVPHVPQSELLPYIRSCDVLVMPFPRKPHYEKCMSPLKLFEYMASGVPVISTDLPSVREIVGNGDVHFIKDNSHGEIARGIRDLRKDAARAESLAGSSLEKSRRYTWLNRAESIMAFLSHGTRD